MNPIQIREENITLTPDFCGADEVGQKLLTACAQLSDEHGIIDGHSVASIALRAGVPLDASVEALQRLCAEGALTAFHGPAGWVWVLENSDPDVNFL